MQFFILQKYVIVLEKYMVIGKYMLNLMLKQLISKLISNI